MIGNLVNKIEVKLEYLVARLVEYNSDIPKGSPGEDPFSNYP